MNGNLSLKKGLISEMTDKELTAIAEMLYVWAGFNEADITKKEDSENRLNKERFIESCQALTDEELDRLYVSALIIKDIAARLDVAESKADYALSEKADKTEIYTMSEVEDKLSGKVDKEEGKVLSDNNLTAELIEKIIMSSQNTENIFYIKSEEIDDITKSGVYFVDFKEADDDYLDNPDMILIHSNAQSLMFENADKTLVTTKMQVKIGSDNFGENSGIQVRFYREKDPFDGIVPWAAETELGWSEWKYVEDFGKATTLSGYGIEDAYTKSEIDANYVKNTDYASATKAGVVKITGGSGVYMYNGEELAIACATSKAILYKASATNPIVPANLDYAVYSSTHQSLDGEYDPAILTVGTTFSEQPEALPVSYKAVKTAIGDIDSALDELHNYAQGLISGGEN